MTKSNEVSTFSVKTLVDNIISSLEKEREREIISRRFGLYDRKETLEQIGEMLGITRERVRQLEKIIINQLSNSNQKQFVNNISKFDDFVMPTLTERGNLIRVSDLAQVICENANKIDNSRVSFLAKLSSQLELVEEDDAF